MKIVAKLLMGFIAVALLCAVVGVVGVVQMGSMQGSLRTISDLSIPSLQKLYLTDVELLKLKVAVRSLTNEHGLDNAVYYKRQIDNIESARTNYRARLEEFEKLEMVPEEARLYQTFKGLLEKGAAYNDDIIEAVEKARVASGEEREAATLATFELVDGDRRLDYDNMLNALIALIRFDEDYYGIKLPKAAIAGAQASIVLLIVATIISFIIALILGIVLGQSISKGLGKTVKILNKLAVGDTGEKIEVKSKDEIGVMGQSLNLVIDALKNLIQEMNHMSKEHDAGDIDVRVEAEKFQGAYKEMAEGVNLMVFGHIAVKKKAMACVGEFSRGNFEAPLERFPGKKAFINDAIELLRTNLKNLVADANMLIEAAIEGKLQTRADATKHQGDYRKIVEGVNKTLDAVIGPLNVAAKYVDDISKGNIPAKITDNYNGDFNVIKMNLNVCIDAVNTLVADALMLSQAAIEGKLQTRADGSKHQGDYRKIVNGVNQTLDLVITPVNETIEILKHLAEGDLTHTMTGDYKGDFDVLKTALNSSLDSVGDILSQVNLAVDQVAAGSGQVSQASQSLSQGAAEQASSLEEITSSITQISSQTKQNTESAIQVNGLAKGARDNAEQGNIQMKDLVLAMSDINASAEEIRKIVKAIDDISFQINLLALNANVEAARAGKYGKGFAVVAEEVRNLAVRSANSVKETTRMVEEAINNIGRGNNLVDLTAKQLSEIVGGASKVADLAEEVATASKEQSQGLEQITTGLNQIDQVTQGNTASAEESASAAEELSSQAQQLKGMISRFKLKAAKEQKVGNAEMLAMLRAELAREQAKSLTQLAGPRHEAGAKPEAPKKRFGGGKPNPQDVIALDDDNFGKF